MVYVIGHKKPDTDSVCASIVYARHKKAVPAVASPINKETAFVLARFKVDTPKLIGSASGEQLILVDHNEWTQAVDGAQNAEIVEVIDHHRIGGITTPKPIFFHVEPVGSTSTIISRIVDVTSADAPLLLAGILSDTMAFKSPTTTDDDRKAAENLAAASGIDMASFAKELFKAKSDISGMSAEQLLDNDAKEYDMGGKKVLVGQIELADLTSARSMKKEFLSIMKARVKMGYHTILLALTDVIAEGSEILVASESPELVEKAFGQKLMMDSFYAKGILSRKKQLIPVLEGVLGKAA